MEVSIYHGRNIAERVVLFSTNREEEKLFKVFAKRIKKSTVKMAIKDDEVFLTSGPKEIQAKLTIQDKIFLENRLKIANSKMQLCRGNQTNLVIDFT